MPKPNERKRPTGTLIRNSVGHIIWSRDLDALLGRYPDRAIAQILNCSAMSVARRRYRLKIPAFRPEMNWTGPMLDLLSDIPDREVARLFGISLLAVRAKRYRLGLPQTRFSVPS